MENEPTIEEILEAISAFNAAMGAVSTNALTAMKVMKAASSQPEPDEFWTPHPVIGYRAWTLGGRGKTVLIGRNGAVWRKRTMTAVDLLAKHPAPHWQCGCGINAMKQPFGDMFGEEVVGRVALTGVVHEYERGYRAEHGEIIDLALSRLAPRPTRKVLSDHYGVPVYRGSWKALPPERTLNYGHG